jgi:hypothetical protein
MPLEPGEERVKRTVGHQRLHLVGRRGPRPLARDAPLVLGAHLGEDALRPEGLRREQERLRSGEAPAIDGRAAHSGPLDTW